MIINVKIFCPEAITIMLWHYALKAFAEQLNVLKVDYDVITPIEKFIGTTSDITHKITTSGSVQFMSWM